MADISKATPRPWRQDTQRSLVIIAGDRNDERIVTGVWGNDDPDEGVANAELIVRAVNAYDDLVAALKVAESWFKVANPFLQELANSAYWGPIYKNQEQVSLIVKNALAKARGEVQP